MEMNKERIQEINELVNTTACQEIEQNGYHDGFVFPVIIDNLDDCLVEATVMTKFNHYDKLTDETFKDAEIIDIQINDFYVHNSHA